MTKARRMMEANLKLIDVVVELVDARIPFSTRNRGFDDLFINKDRVIILNKIDLADPKKTQRWAEFYRQQGFNVLEFISTQSGKKNKAVELIDKAVKAKVEALKQKGINKTVRVMIVGIPNVGKSTFINKISGASSTQVGNRPGVTRGKQWVKITPYLELMDTPGMFPPKFDSQYSAKRLAFIGSIRDEIIDSEWIAIELLNTLIEIYPDEIILRYKKVEKHMRDEALLDAICLSRGFILAGGMMDTDRAARVVLDEFRSGKLGRVTLEDIGDNERALAEERAQKKDQDE